MQPSGFLDEEGLSYNRITAYHVISTYIDYKTENVPLKNRNVSKLWISSVIFDAVRLVQHKYIAVCILEGSRKQNSKRNVSTSMFLG